MAAMRDTLTDAPVGVWPEEPASGSALAGWIALTVGGGSLIGAWTNGGADPWYVALDKAPWNPPAWVFAPVWTTLYVLMALAAWFVWRRGGWRHQSRALTLFVLQLALNFAWSPLFFVARQPGLALLDLAALWMLVVWTMRAFARVQPLASWLLAPYLAWVTYAATLNAWVVVRN